MTEGRQILLRYDVTSIASRAAYELRSVLVMEYRCARSHTPRATR